jgi:hypothetical protein
MLTMTLAFWLYSFAAAFSRLRGIILLREQDSAWVREMITAEAGAPPRDSAGGSGQPAGREVSA